MGKIELVTALLNRIRTYLVCYSVRTWPEILTEWEGMLSRVRTDEEAAAVFKHIHEGLWGMGRLGDVVITPEASHAVTAEHGSLNGINEELMLLVKALSDQVRIQPASRDKNVS
jgi:hypothetical protein